MENNLTNSFSITVFIAKAEWHTCIKNAVIPLIKQFDNNKLSLTNLRFNFIGRESIEIEVSVHIPVNEMTDSINLHFNNSYKFNHEITHNVGNEDEDAKQSANLLIQKLIANSIIDVLCDDVIDNDTIVTFALYSLLACYKAIPEYTRLSLAKEVLDYSIARAEHHIEIDHKFYQVKYHNSREQLNKLFIDVFNDNNNTLKWLCPIQEQIFSLAQDVKTTKSLVNLFLDITECIKNQLYLNMSSLIMINKFVFNLLSEGIINKSIGLPLFTKNDIIALPKQMNNNQNKIPLLTYYSPSHEQLFNQHFYPSYSKYFNGDFELLVLKDKQNCDVIFRQGT